MNGRQKLELILAGSGVLLLLFWLFTAEGGLGRVMGIISNTLLIFGMLLSFRAEEKLKKNKDKR